MSKVWEPPRVAATHEIACIDEPTLKQALAALQRGPIKFRRNNVIACEGDAADYVFLVVSGVVRSCKTFENGGRNVVAFYLPGDLFGWGDQKCTLSVEACTDAMVLFIKRDGLMSIAAQENRVASSLLSIATNELRRAQDHAVLMSQSAKARLVSFLTDWSKRSGGTRHVSVPMSYQDVADHLGITIETISRTLTALERSELITRVSPHTLTIRNNRALLRLIT